MLGLWAAAILLHLTAMVPGISRLANNDGMIAGYGSSETCHSIWKSDPAAALTFCAPATNRAGRFRK